MSNKKKHTYDRGLFAETIAVIFLSLKGYRIMCRRYKTPVGEIDIIAKKRNNLIFVEVKARKTKKAALESVTEKMKSRIERAAQHYLSTHKLTNQDCRFDLITVTGFCRCHHLDNAWQAQA